MSVLMSAGYRLIMSRPARWLARPVVRRLPAGARRQLRRRLDRHRRRFSRRARAPRLSIVIPVYNVEDYVAGALDSLLAQTMSDWEAIVVDDGASDRSAEIVDAYAASDSRIRVIHQSNAGLGAARNTGVGHVSGMYLTFLDADDLVPRGAYEAAIKTLHRTGSDFAIGATQRMQNTTTYSPAWSRHLHARAQQRITVDELPEVMMDIIAGNRIFKTSFWRRQVGAFPTDMAYEDHRVMVTALIRADAFDVLSTVTYLWRVRQDGESISQQKPALSNLVDRVRAHAEAYAILQTEASPAATTAWLTRILDIDVPLFAEHTPNADAEYRAVAQAFARRYVDVADAGVWAGVRWQQRIICLLMAAARWTDLEQFRVDLRGRVGLPGTIIENGRVRLDLSRWHDSIGELLTGRDLVGERHTRLYPRVDHQEWTRDGLRLDGFAYIAHVTPDESAAPKLTLVNQRTGLPLAAPPPTSVHNSRANEFANHQYFDYSAAGFSVVLDWDLLTSLFEPGNGTPADSWELRAELSWHGIARTAAVDTTCRRGSAGALRSELDPEQAIFISPVRVNNAVHFQARRIYAALEQLHTDGEKISGLITVPPRDGYIPTAIGAGRDQVPLRPALSLSVSNPAWSSFTFQDFPLNQTETERPKVTFANGVERSLGWNMDTVDLQMLRSHVARRSHFGFIDIVPAAQCLASTAGYNGNTLTVHVEHGLVEPRQTPHFGLHSSSTDAILDADDVWINDKTATVTFDLTRRGPTGQPLRGIYYVYAGDAPVIPADNLIRTLPHTAVTSTYRVELLRAPATHHGALAVALGPPLNDQEQGPWAQSQLQEWFQSTHFEPLHAIMFQCYRGESATDSQRAIHQELVRRGTDLTLYWSVQDGTVTVPRHGVPIIIGSRRWYELLGSVKYLCNNIDFDRFFVRRPHQRFLQTFHGHPFKAMGRTYWQMTGQSELSIEHEARRRQQLWTAAIMPNTESVSYYEADYGLEHRYLVTGYPRNDAIVTGDTASARRRVAHTLDIDPAGTWALYAPTWREKSATGTWSATMFDALNLDKLSTTLGPSWTILIRGHNHNARENARILRQGSVVDATDYPEINDLILAADIAVLDYSSLRFDWAITRKPMVFFVPDKTEYLTRRPGLFDFEESAPGRQATTTEEVATALLESDHYTQEYGTQLEDFNTRFNPLTDGHATQRVVDAFIGAQEV